LQIFFPGKVSNGVVNKLQQKAFRWSPTSGAWQRFRSTDALYAACSITGIKTDYS